MLRRLQADDPRFKHVEFREGLNLIVADSRGDASSTDTRNGSGKSSLIEILHFLLGARFERSKSFLAKESLRSIEFGLYIDWPRLQDRTLLVQRSPARQNQIFLHPDITGRSSLVDVARRVSPTEWHGLIERDLYSIPPDSNVLSGRSMLSQYIRRISANAFNEPIRTTPQQTLAKASTNLSYLLGLDWQLSGKYRDLAARESTRRQLSAASKDPVWGKIVGRSSELRGQISDIQQRVNEIENQIAAFRVVPEYERIQARADDIDKQIRRMRSEDLVDRRNIADLEAAAGEVSDPDIDYLPVVYENLGLSLPTAVLRRYDEVSDFHSSVVRNRQDYLSAEISSIRARLSAREEERIRLGEEQARLLRLLNEGGALDALTAMQQSLAAERAELESLRNRFKAASTLEASASEIKAERAQVENQMRADLMERDRILNDISVLFRKYAIELYGGGRSAYLAIEPTSSHLRFIPHIDSKDSRGIGNMVMFCFDLTVAVTAHRGKRGPDFLVHDSHLFDGVDERQVGRALRLAREVADEEGMQYVATLNSDDLAKIDSVEPKLKDCVIPPRLTDAFDDGGLFGFRFS